MSKQAINSKEVFESLGALAQEQACLVLAHYLKEASSCFGNEGAQAEAERAARIIRAAFAELEGVEDAARSKPDEHPQPLDLRPYQAQALANLLGRDDTYGYGGDVTVFNEAAIAIHSAFTHLNLLWARESGSNPPDVGETPLAASSASQGSD